MNGKSILSNYIRQTFKTVGPKSHWFGYYNYSPISADGAKILAHEVDFDGRDIRPDDTADVGWYDLKTGEWHKIATTHAINWQQGAMLQWLGPDFNTRVVFNDVEGGHFCSRICNIVTGETKTVPFPVYGVSPDGKFSITLQFERSAWCRAYHYESIRNPEWNVSIPEKDGIFRVDLKTGAVRRIIPIREIIDKLTPEELVGATGKHWFEHIMLNPTGERFAFYHRYSRGNGHWTKGFTANVDGSHVVQFPGPPRTTYSHLGWRSEFEFVVFSEQRARMQQGYIAIRNATKKSFKSVLVSIVRRIVRMVVPEKMRQHMLQNNYYAFVRDEKCILGDTRNCKISQLGDGHPSFTKDGRYMLTDTYADSTGYRNLILFDCEKKSHIVLGRFYSPFNACGYRADLHPRFNRDEKKVIIDSAHSGQHQLYVLDIDWSKIK